MLTGVSLVIGIICGIVMHRSDYCIAGMFRDAIMFRHTSMLHVLVFQILITMVLFEILRQTGALPFYPYPLLGKPSLANLIGGIVFGAGMVLAGGCVVGTLYKMGAGSVTSFFAFIGLIIGSGLYAEIHPYWGAFSKSTVLSDTITIPQLFGISPLFIVISVSIPTIYFLFRWNKKLPECKSMVDGYIKPWKTAIVLAVLGASSYILLGMPIGISTTYAKIAAIFENFFAPDHVNSLAYFHGEPLNIFNRIFNTPMRGGAGPARDAIWAIQFPLIIGITGGSTISAVLLKEFAIHYKIPAQQLFIALFGGAIMGFGARMSSGCNVWHLLGGIPVLATSSILFTIGLPLGAWIGGKALFKLISKQNN